MRRRWWLLGAGIASLGLPTLWFLVFLNTAGRSPITRENCDRIRLGMTRHDVEAIIGPSNVQEVRYTGPLANSVMFGQPEQWVGEDVEIDIWFRDDGTVRWKGCSYIEREPEPIWRKLRRFLPW